MEQEISRQRAALQQQINGHPLLALPPQQRQDQRLRLELMRLVLRYFAFDKQLERDTRNPDSALLKNEESLRRAQYDPASRGRQYDNLAFMNAICEAMARYDGEKGVPFLSYFQLLYRQKLVREARQSVAVQEQKAFGPLKKRDMELLKKLNAFLLRRHSPHAAENLPAGLCASLAAELGVTESALRQLLAVVRMANTIAPRPAEEGEEEELPAPDPQSEGFVRAVELAQQLSDLLDRLCETEQKEYARLFLTNDLLRPLKEEELTDDVGYARLLLRHEAALFRAVFALPYLCFVYCPPPQPDSIRNLIAGKLRLPLPDSSIAAYKQVGAPAVSMAHRRFQKLQQTLRRQMLEQE